MVSQNGKPTAATLDFDAVSDVFNMFLQVAGTLPIVQGSSYNVRGIVCGLLERVLHVAFLEGDPLFTIVRSGSI